MKILKVSLAASFALFALSSSANAFDTSKSGAFVGAEIGALSSNASIKAKDDEGSGGKKVNKIAFGYGLKAGYDFGGLVRAYGSISSATQTSKKFSEDDGDYTIKYTPSYKLAIGVDYTPQITRDIKAQVGAFVGYGAAKGKFEDGDSASITANGFLYGVKAGAIFEIFPQNEIDVSLRYEGSQFKKTQNGTKWTFDTNNIGLFVGYTYHF